MLKYTKDTREIEKILRSLEPVSRELDPSAPERKELSEKVWAYSESFLSGLAQRLTYDKPPEGWTANFPIDEAPSDIDEILSLIEKQVDSKGINPASGGHLGYIPGGGLFPSAWGDYLADITNRYVGIYFASPGGVSMEHTLIQWMCRLVGYDHRSGGTFTSGGSLAYLTAVVNARDSMGITSAIIPRSVVYLTEQIHHCAQKAMRIAGLSECVIRTVPMTGFKIDPGALELQIQEDLNEGLKPFMVMASAGTTEAGVVDPLKDIALVARRYKLWYHVDAAYGGFFMLTDHGKQIMQGIELSDSLIIDPHKGMFLPYGSGALLVKDQRKLFESQHYFANYMQDAVPVSGEISPADLSPELSRHFRGLRMWLPLRLFGVAPFRAALEEKLWLARYFYQKIMEMHAIEVGPYPDLSVTFFRVIPKSGSADSFNKRLVKSIQDDGRVFFSSTTLDGKFYLRLAVLNFRTHLEQVNLALEILKEKIALLNESHS